MGYQYILFYKPYNVLSQFSPGSTPPDSDSAHRLTLKDFISVADVYPVGRLDRDSEGLMLLTNHGRVQHRLSEPRFGHPRTYWVQVEQVPSANALAQLRQGVTIKGYRTQPCQVELLMSEPLLPERDPPIRYRQSIPTAWLAMTLQEGKNRQVRRMTAAVGHPTLRLVRQAIAHLHLGNLQPGQWRHATPDEQRGLLDI
ncbi:pseudouridine synthase [Phormidium tenue]|uniref:Pseudouridine synthase n=1 Tax=Phormidium tenue NIES-30 TaxID=549789 RepID=A0A1U7J8R1_9CYAN|nr:pseudouridine synthase [Phormidium tenue]MBD2231078.1 pseudouridine synthase [Phormidium tenue FACHB-1052]OKH49893.1 pseudouridine synthase [Phormidium tenue NIES-30]